MTSPPPPPPPSTLPEALARIAQLEAKLAFARSFVRVETGKDLDVEFEAAASHASGSTKANVPTEAQLNVAQESAVGGSSQDDKVSDDVAKSGAPANDTAATEEEPVDLGPLVLRALALRKNVHTGAMSSEEAHEEVRTVIEAHKLSDERASTLRDWAGL